MGLRDAALRVIGKAVLAAGGQKSFTPLIQRYGYGLPGSDIDYQAEAGDTWSNSIVSATIGWVGRAISEAPIRIQERDTDSGKYEYLDTHKLEDLLGTPNGFYGTNPLLHASALSLLCDGNCYWLKQRATSGRVAALWYLPHFCVMPIYYPGGPEFIVAYRYTTFNGASVTVPPSEIVHMRMGLDPLNMRLGMSPLKAALREIVTDNEGSAFSAASLRNMGMPGVIITPGDDQTIVGQPQADQIKASWKDKFTRDKRFEPLVLTGNMKVTPVGWSPSQVSVDVLRRIPEERITAALGVPAIVAGMGAGLARSTFANYAEAREAAYDQCIMPLQHIISDELTRQILTPDFGGTPAQRVAFDNSEVRALQPDLDKLVARFDMGVRGGWVKVSEARQEIDLPTQGGDDVYLRPANVVPTTSQGMWMNAQETENPPEPTPPAEGGNGAAADAASGAGPDSGQTDEPA
jgi:HK97 family phage portal protein